jgi:hypothetical protein
LAAKEYPVISSIFACRPFQLVHNLDSNKGDIKVEVRKKWLQLLDPRIRKLLPFA